MKVNMQNNWHIGKCYIKTNLSQHKKVQAKKVGISSTLSFSCDLVAKPQVNTKSQLQFTSFDFLEPHEKIWWQEKNNKNRIQKFCIFPLLQSPFKTQLPTQDQATKPFQYEIQSTV